MSISKFYRAVMSITPQALLCNSSREQCIKKLNELPSFITNNKLKVNAAVLVPLCVVDNEVCLLYTLRSSNLNTHKGQVSFPGGKMDAGESVYDTAVRETEEEIGFRSEDIEIWAKMSPVQARDRNIVIVPVVGLLKNLDMKKLKPNMDEVAEIFTVPMKLFCDKENHASFVHNNLTIPLYEVGSKYRIWGITGMITHFFLQSFLPEDIYQTDFLKKEYKLEELLTSKL
ncbi:unnamed protein product [Arctia plantaginis]|uniref:Nudix hydrolase domain-containing protein n=1 Tax=Arctia plantaginis TaxID=874455 RepID=A0A8S0ZR98_ARCPL|nr:unnamed protein product [Arctia plantaginis]